MMHATSRNYHAFMSCTAEPGWLPEAQLQLTERATDTGTWTTDLVACDRRNGDATAARTNSGTCVTEHLRGAGQPGPVPVPGSVFECAPVGFDVTEPPVEQPGARDPYRAANLSAALQAVEGIVADWIGTRAYLG